MSNGPNPTPSHAVPVPAAVAAQAARAEELQRAQQVEQPQEQQPELPMGLPPAEQPSQEEQHRTYSENDMRAMRGRLEREAAENKLLVERLNGLEALLAQTQTQPPQELPPEQDPKRFLTAQEEEEYGTEFLDVTKRAALEVVSPEVAALKRDIEYLKRGMGAVGQNIAKTAKESMYDKLDAEVPDWEQINEHPYYHQWLNQVDPYSGARRKSMLDHAFSRHDGQRVVTFFKGFLAEAAATDPQAPQGTARQTPAPQANGQRPSLATYAAPGRAGSAAQPSSAGKPVYTRSDISLFYRAKAEGRYRGREAEADAIDADIIMAAQEGRVVS